MARKRSPGPGRKPKGEFKGKLATFSTRITPELRAGLDREAERSGRSLSQEVEYRLRNSLEMPAEVQKQWGPEHIKALAQLVSQVAQWVEHTVGAWGFGETRKELYWHKNAFTHVALRVAVDDVLEWYRPEGTISVPQAIEAMAKSFAQFGQETVERERTPEAVGLASARMLHFEMARMKLPPIDHPTSVEYGGNYYRMPQIVKALGPPSRRTKDRK